MKHSALKISALSLVPEAAEYAPPQSEKGASLRDFFSGWLESVSPAALPAKTNGVDEGQLPYRPLTAFEITRVALATVRESSEHRHWPPDVIQQFRAADVIRREQKR